MSKQRCSPTRPLWTTTGGCVVLRLLTTWLYTYTKTGSVDWKKDTSGHTGKTASPLQSIHPKSYEQRHLMNRCQPEMNIWFQEPERWHLRNSQAIMRKQANAGNWFIYKRAIFSFNITGWLAHVSQNWIDWPVGLNVSQASRSITKDWKSRSNCSSDTNRCSCRVTTYAITMAHLKLWCPRCGVWNSSRRATGYRVIQVSTLCSLVSPGLHSVRPCASYRTPHCTLHTYTVHDLMAFLSLSKNRYGNRTQYHCSSEHWCKENDKRSLICLEITVTCTFVFVVVAVVVVFRWVFNKWPWATDWQGTWYWITKTKFLS